MSFLKAFTLTVSVVSLAACGGEGGGAQEQFNVAPGQLDGVWTTGCKTLTQQRGQNPMGMPGWGMRNAQYQPGMGMPQGGPQGGGPGFAGGPGGPQGQGGYPPNGNGMSSGGMPNGFGQGNMPGRGGRPGMNQDPMAQIRSSVFYQDTFIVSGTSIRRVQTIYNGDDTCYYDTKVRSVKTMNGVVYKQPRPTPQTPGSVEVSIKWINCTGCRAAQRRTGEGPYGASVVNVSKFGIFEIYEGNHKLGNEPFSRVQNQEI